MRSLQVKFSLLVVSLLAVACVGLAWLATRHERTALVAGVERRGLDLARNLAGDAKEPLLAEDALSLESLANQIGQSEGVVAARLLNQKGEVAGSFGSEEKSLETPSPASFAEAGPAVRRLGNRLIAAAPISFSEVRIGEAQIELDLGALVEPVVADSQRQLGYLAVGVVALGVACGVGFVALLVGPLRRLRAGVERLAHGDFTARVAPSSADEVGELTRAFNQMGESLQEKERIQSAFGRYASDYVLNQLLEGPEGSEIEGSEREVTILFADIRRFTRLSEGMKAADVVALLNEIFQLASDCILAHSGTIDKFIGDSVMAYFGAPVPQRDHALRAVNAAIDIERAMGARNANRDASGRVEIGIGIHTGSVVVGTIGSDRRSDFTAIGDAVNVAHRLEKLSRPGEILVSEAVQRHVRGAVRLDFEGERQLSGRLEPVHVYSVDVESAASRAL